MAITLTENQLRRIIGDVIQEESRRNYSGRRRYGSQRQLNEIGWLPIAGAMASGMGREVRRKDKTEDEKYQEEAHLSGFGSIPLFGALRIYFLACALIMGSQYVGEGEEAKAAVEVVRHLNDSGSFNEVQAFTQAIDALKDYSGDVRELCDELKQPLGELYTTYSSSLTPQGKKAIRSMMNACN
jgi:hypothetical protein